MTNHSRAEIMEVLRGIQYQP